MLRMAIGLLVGAGAAAALASATSTGSTRSSISRSRSPRWRRIGTAPSPATSTSSPGRTRRPRRTASRFRSRTAPRSSSRTTRTACFPGLKDVPPRDRPPVVAGVLRLPHHDRDRLLHDRGGAVRRVPVVARHAVRDALVSAGDGADLVDRLRRGDRRLGRDRERPPALDRAGHPAHRRRHLAGDRPGDRRDVRAVRPGLRHRLLGRHLFHQPPDREGPARPRATDEPAVSLGGALAAAGKSTGRAADDHGMAISR